MSQHCIKFILDFPVLPDAGALEISMRACDSIADKTHHELI